MSRCTRPVGAYLLFLAFARDDKPRRASIGKVVGYDMGRSKYEYRTRISGWGRYFFSETFTCWAFETEVLAELTEEQAMAQLVHKDDGRVLLFEIDWVPGGTGGGKVWELIDGQLVARETHASYQAACDAYGEDGWKNFL